VSRRIEFSPEAPGDWIDLYDCIALHDGMERTIACIDRIANCLPQSFGISGPRHRARRPSGRFYEYSVSNAAR
jgi:plasmid stabilization system protein ParE